MWALNEFSAWRQNASDLCERWVETLDVLERTSCGSVPIIDWPYGPQLNPRELRSRLRALVICIDCSACSMNWCRQSQPFFLRTWFGIVPYDPLVGYYWFRRFLTTWLEQLDFKNHLQQVHFDPHTSVLFGWQNVKVFIVYPLVEASFYAGVNDFQWGPYCSHPCSVLFHRISSSLTTVVLLLTHVTALRFIRFPWQNLTFVLICLVHIRHTMACRAFPASKLLFVVATSRFHRYRLLSSTYFGNLKLWSLFLKWNTALQKVWLPLTIWRVLTIPTLITLTLAADLGSTIIWRLVLPQNIYCLQYPIVLRRPSTFWRLPNLRMITFGPVSPSVSLAGNQ